MSEPSSPAVDSPQDVAGTPQDVAGRGPVSEFTQASDLVSAGSLEARSEVDLAPIVEGVTRVPVAIEYFEDVSGGVDGPYVSYRISDGGVLLLSVDLEFDLGHTWIFSASSSPVRGRIEGAERAVMAGSMTLESSGDKLRIEFDNLEFEGSEVEVDGYVLGVPLERCRRLVSPPTGAASADGVDNRVLEVDEGWSSPFCSGIQRAFP